jgi:uncharacterized membrane protein
MQRICDSEVRLVPIAAGTCSIGRSHNTMLGLAARANKKRGLRMQADKEPSSTGLTWSLAIIFALVLGGIEDSAGGFFIGALLGLVLAQVLHLRTLIKRQGDQLKALQNARADEPAAPAAARQAPIFEKTEPAPVPPAQTVTAPKPAPIATAREAPPAVDAKPFPSRPSVSPSPPPPPSLIEKGIEDFIRWFKGGNPLARIGIVILFFGATFLAKYAAEHSLFPIELRFIALTLGALALLIVGWRLKDKRAVYAQLLQGGGIAGLYLTVFAASRLYQLLPLGLALALLVVIAVTAAILAVAQNALALAVIGTAGGFLAPIMVSTGGGNHIALFTYYAILNLGVFTVAWFRTWRVLNVLGFVFTFTITGLWRASGYESADLVSADAFLILFFLMYVGVSILNCVRQPPDLRGYVSGSLVFGLPVVAFTLHATLVSKIPYALAWSALALGMFYLVLGWVLWRTRRETFRLLVESFAALGVIFGSLAIPLAFDTKTTAAMWAVEGAGLVWLGMRQQRRLARAFGSLLQVAAGIGFLIGLHRLSSQHPVINSAYLGALMLGVSGLLSSFWWHRDRARIAPYESSAQLVFALWGLAWWLFAGLNEIDTHLPSAVLGGTLLYVSISAALLAFIGIRARWSLPQTFALHLPALVALFGLVYAMHIGHPFAQWGESGWLAVLAVHLGLLYLLDVGRLESQRATEKILHAFALWLIALLAAWEISWWADRLTGGVWPSLSWGLVPALLLAVLGRDMPVPAWPLRRHVATYRTLAAVPLALFAMLWTAFVDLTNVGDPLWLPYIPLLNPLDVSVALCLAGVALWWTSLRDEQRSSLWPNAEQQRGPMALMAALIFLWLNAALIRALHYLIDTPITTYGIMTSTVVQSSLSIFWGLLGFAAMTVAARQRWRHVWLVGAALMIVVVAKLFLIDLSSIGTIARIASFLSVGVLLLVTGYLAPLPPKRSDELATSEQRT